MKQCTFYTFNGQHPARIGVWQFSKRQLERGVTLVEVLIVVAIVAMVAGGVTVFALPRYKEAQIKSAETWARTIRAAIQNWQAATNETSCPTVSQLVQEKHLIRVLRPKTPGVRNSR